MANLRPLLSWLFVVGLCLAAGVAASMARSAHAQQVQWRVRPGGAPRDDLEEQTPQREVLPKASHETLQRLHRARRAFDAEKYLDAAAELQILLASGEDGFIPPADDDATLTTARREARRLIGAMPAVDRRSYELRFGPHARSLLEAAVRNRDHQALARIAEECFHTKAGYEAAILLACDRLDRGQPREAIAWLRRIGESSAAIEHCEPEYWLLLTICWLSAGDRQQANVAFGRLKQRCPEASFRVGASEFVASRDAVQAWQAMERLTGKGIADAQKTDQSLSRDWRVFRGNSARNAYSAFSGNLGPSEWTVPLMDDEKGLERLRSARQSSTLRGSPPLPALHPVVLGDTVLLRTPSQLLAVDVASGRKRWEYPWDRVSDDSDRQVSEFVYASPRPLDVAAERAFRDAAYGQLSSDGRLVFLLDHLAAADQRFAPMVLVGPAGAGRARVFRSASNRSTNQLVALQKAGGKLAWSVGLDSGEDEPRLAGAFFLGPPLPDGPWLYALAELKGEVLLCVLHASTGRLEWSQAIAAPGQIISRDAVRRLAGVTPSLADGVLVCPTVAGAVVGIDTATRSLLWGYPYPRLERGPATWADASITIADGRVILTPPDSDLLYCLDLVSGREIWSCRREERLLAACVHQGKVVLVGPHEVTALSLSDRKPAWKSPVTLPSQGMPSGRGLYCGRFYYLPTTAKQLLQIDLEDGRVVRQIETPRVLGNLLGLGDRLISQTGEQVELFTRGGATP